MEKVQGSVDIDQLLNRPIGSYRIFIFALCALVLAVEGFDMYMTGAMVPAIAQALKIEPAVVATVFVAQGVGLALGYTAISPFADYYGRRLIISLCVVGFGVLTLATVLAETLTALTILRFAAFFFFGGAIPTVTAYIGEMVTPDKRQRYIILLATAFPIGAAISSVVVPQLVNKWGWTAPFWAGGLFPLVLVPLVAAMLPESVRYMTLNRYPTDQIRSVLVKMGAKEAATNSAFHVNEEPRERATLAMLVSEGRASATVLLVIISFAMTFVVNLVAAWLPTYLHLMSGFEMTAASGFMAFSSLGMIVWPVVVMIPLIRWVGIKYAIALSFALGAACLMLFALSPVPTAIAIVLTIGFGAFVVSAINSVQALIATLYPTKMRATALGWISGLGRIGSIVGPGIGGLMLAQQFSPLTIGLVFSIPLVVAMFLTLSLRRTEEAPALREVAQTP